MNVHGPNQGNDRFFARLGTLMGELPNLRRLLIAGDFNCHLSNAELTDHEKLLIGKYAGHNTFNANGQQMRLFINLHDLCVRSTQVNANPAFKTTWTNGAKSSQVDHLVTSLDSQLFLTRMQCLNPNVATDHRILICDIIDRKTRLTTVPSSSPQTTKKPRLEASLLKNETIRKKFQEQLAKNHVPSPSDSCVQNVWLRLSDKIRRSATAVLDSKNSIPPDRQCRLALGEVKRCSFRAGRSAHPKWTFKLQEAKEELRRRVREYEEKQIVHFFENLSLFPVGERINKTYQFLKRYKTKKNNNRRWTTKININDWVEETDEPCMIPPLLNEDPNEPLPDPPTLSEIESIILNAKNGKSPGIDGIPAEFYKYADPQTLHDLHHLLCKIWKENEHPADWKKTVVVPIPKTPSPKSVDDYRRICLSSTAYKIYAIWLLKKLQTYVGPIGVHQSAFLPGRSTIDHLHVLQRVMQETWNQGDPLLLMSLDIRKAFDRISLTSLPAILKGKLIKNIN